MPRDIDNMPFPRSAPFQTTESEDKTPRDASLKLENMLLEEFNYASVTAYQAQEDRARMFNLYLLLIGVLGSGLAAVYQLGGGLKAFAGELSVALLLVAGLMGIAFFVKLIRLRQAWRDSMLAMTLIKEYYIREFSATAPLGVRAFYWRLKTLPTGEKRGSTTFVVCATVATLGNVCFAGATLVIALLNLPGWLGASPAIDPTLVAWLTASFVLVASELLSLRFYSRQFDRVRESAQTLHAANVGGLPIGDIWDSVKSKLNAHEQKRVIEMVKSSDGVDLLATSSAAAASAH